MPIEPVAFNAPDLSAYVSDEIDDRPQQSTSTSDPVPSGWDAAESLTSPATDFPTEVKFEEGKHLVFKFLDENGPFANYKQHFLTRKTSGKRSYVCIAKAAEYKDGTLVSPAISCPLCIRLEDRPENKRAFSVVTLNSDTGMPRQMLIAGARLYQALHAAQTSPQGPLTKGYWAIVRTGTKTQTQYIVTPIKERDLEEDWNIDAAKAATAVSSYAPYPSSLIKKNSYAELDEIASDLE